MNSVSENVGVASNLGIAVAVKTTYLDKAPVNNEKTFLFGKINNPNSFFIWMYKIAISNESNRMLQLKSFEFNTIGETGIKKQVTHEPETSSLFNSDLILSPGQFFESHELLALPTRSAILFGKLIFQDLKNGETVDIIVEPVSLDSNESKAVPN